MHFTITVFMILAASSLSSCQNNDEIIRQDFDGPHDDGSYRWAIQTGGGIYHEQRGGLQASPAGGEPSLFMQGQYQYTAPDGQVINVLYRAGEGGFQAVGAHIPTPPPVPAAIQRSLAHLATKPPTDYDYQ